MTSSAMPGWTPTTALAAGGGFGWLRHGGHRPGRHVRLLLRRRLRRRGLQVLRCRRNGPQKGESLRASLTITFEEAAFGCEKEINLNRTEECDACHGSGCEPGHHSGDLP